MTPDPGSHYLWLAGIATFGAFVCIVCSRELRVDARLWLAVAVVATSVYLASRSGLVP